MPASLERIAHDLIREVEALRFGPPVTHVYNPLAYAQGPYRRYIDKYGRGRKEVLLVGMNPGPWGMVQTGIPFGEVTLVRDWLGIHEPVGRPAGEHPKRPVHGFACLRSEVSGARVWSWARESFGTPRRFFRHFFVSNYCPLAFFEQNGRNRTPDKLPVAERQPLLKVCDRALRRTVEYFQPGVVVGVGRFAEQCARRALGGLDITVGRILHPSPASPAANRDWAAQATAQLTAYGIDLGPQV